MTATSDQCAIAMCGKFFLKLFRAGRRVFFLRLLLGEEHTKPIPTNQFNAVFALNNFENNLQLFYFAKV